MEHTCYHEGHGLVDVHGCLCAIGRNHTTTEFRTWHAAQGIAVLSSQIA